MTKQAVQEAAKQAVQAAAAPGTCSLPLAVSSRPFRVAHTPHAGSPLTLSCIRAGGALPADKMCPNASLASMALLPWGAAACRSLNSAK